MAPQSLIKRGFFPDALNLYEIRARALGIELDEVRDWHLKAKGMGIEIVPPFPFNGGAEATEEEPKQKKKRRRRRKRREAGAAAAETYRGRRRWFAGWRCAG